ncbi:MAG: HAD family hydrolase [Lachnospiraceae bacterium]|nr:HAD family hydrolase [Lachnospiraceae bacterium]
MWKTILFDLDGTLLPMDQEAFTRAYFNALSTKLAPYGYDPSELTGGIWAGTAAMVKNTGAHYNEEVFWATFSRLLGEKVYADKPLFDEFYQEEFNHLKGICGYAPQAGPTIKKLKGQGYALALASNPVFPMQAQKNRMRWAGVEEDDFIWVTSYENSRYCKPNPRYYGEILERIGCRPQECLMVGNDVAEDMAAGAIGISTFLFTDNLINKNKEDISCYPQGGFGQLLQFICGPQPH